MDKPQADGSRENDRCSVAGAMLLSLASRGWGILFSCALCLLVLFPLPAHAARQVRVGVYENAPKVFTAASGRPAGIFIDVLEDIAQHEGWQITYVHGSWAKGLERLSRGDIDLMPDVAFSAEREGKYSFHKTPVLSSWFQVYTAKNSHIESILDLHRKRVTVLEGSVQQDAFKRLAAGYSLKITLIPQSDYQTAFQMVADGKADAVIANHFYGSMNYKKFGLEDTAILFNPSALFYAAAKDRNGDLLDAIDTRLHVLKNDPQSIYYQSLKRWTGEEVHLALPNWLKALGLVVGVILLMSLVGSVILKRQVIARTKALTEQHARMVGINQALHDSELKHRTLFETANDAILIMREDRITDCNARAPALFGCSREQILGREPFEFSPPVQPDGWRSVDSARDKLALALQGIPQLFEWEHHRWDGTPFTAEVSLNSMELSGEVYLQAMIRNISERKQAEADRIAREAAEEASRAKSAFVANMSHEIRTPLNAVLGFAQVLERDPALTPQQAQHVRTISRSGVHLLQLINDILDMSRIEAGRTILNATAFCLHDLLDDLELMFRSRADSRGLQLIVEWDDSVPRYVSADEGKLRQILVNLIGNAIKFTDTGGVAVRMRAAPAEGTASLRLWVEVEDTGPGIPAADLDRIFEAFQQAESGVKVGGSGLGLAITRTFVNLMGGEITVQSQVGTGSCFRFNVLLAPAAAVVHREILPARRVIGLEPGTGPYRLLVVDDIATNRAVLSELLRPVGFDVREANNGAEALQIFAEWSPQAILMDLRMPVMDGYEAIRQLRSTEAGRTVPIIAVTASAFEDYKGQVIALGVDGYMRKPFRPEELFEILGKCLDLHYVFTDETSPADPTAHLPATGAALPRGLVHAMKLAVADGDMTRLAQLIQQVELVDRAAAQGLHALAERYDYPRIDEWLRKGEPGDG